MRCLFHVCHALLGFVSGDIFLYLIYQTLCLFRVNRSCYIHLSEYLIYCFLGGFRQKIYRRDKTNVYSLHSDVI